MELVLEALLSAVSVPLSAGNCVKIRIEQRLSSSFGDFRLITSGLVSLTHARYGVLKPIIIVRCEVPDRYNYKLTEL